MKFDFSNPNIKYALLILVTLIISVVLAKTIRFIINRFLISSTSKLKVGDPTQFNFLKNAVSFIIYLGAIIFIFYSIPVLKALSLTLFAGAGVLAAIALFASQEAFSNIIGGIFLVVFKPFRVNDIIEVGQLTNGVVEDITLRHTVIRNFENRRMIIPNSVIGSEIITNSSIIEENVRNFFELGISYDSDIDLAIKIIQEEAMKHPDFIDHRTPEEKKQKVPEVIVRVLGFGESSVNLRAYIWSKDHISGFVMKCDLYKSVKEQFDIQGVEIPFPYHTIVYKKDIDEVSNQRKVKSEM